MTRRPLPGASLDSVYLKIERAKHHIVELHGHLKEFTESQPYAGRLNQEGESPVDFWWRFHIRQTKTQDPIWSAILGDAVHNLRSSLDYLLWQVAARNGYTLAVNSRFPIGKSAKDFESMLEGKEKFIGRKAVQIIREAKPYNGGNQAFWIISCLSNTDKHQSLLVMTTAIIGGKATVSVGEWDFFYAPPKRRLMPEDGTPISVQLRLPRSEVPDGADEVGMELQVAIDVAFAEKIKPVGGQSIFPLLSQLADHTQGFVDAFRPLFS